MTQEKLIELAKENRDKYVMAAPFPSIYFDNFFNVHDVRRMLYEFPSVTSARWKQYKNSNEKKFALNDELQMGWETVGMIRYMNSKPFISFLEELTGIRNLIPDPDLEGGGLHQILPGGLLKVHADFNKHPRTGLDRRLNVLLYLNENWKEEYGGHFELWDKGMSEAKVRILPIFNRLAIFSTTSTSYHGHPDPLACPEGMSRKSIALYYYTNGRPKDEENSSHSTIFKVRKDKLEDKKRDLKAFLKLFIPPIIFRL